MEKSLYRLSNIIDAAQSCYSGRDIKLNKTVLITYLKKNGIGTFEFKKTDKGRPAYFIDEHTITLLIAKYNEGRTIDKIDAPSIINRLKEMENTSSNNEDESDDFDEEIDNQHINQNFEGSQTNNDSIHHSNDVKPSYQPNQISNDIINMMEAKYEAIIKTKDELIEEKNARINNLEDKLKTVSDTINYYQSALPVGIPASEVGNIIQESAKIKQEKDELQSSLNKSAEVMQKMMEQLNDMKSEIVEIKKVKVDPVKKAKFSIFNPSTWKSKKG